MSFILDALKKSESERQRQSGPGVFQPRIASPRARFPLWAIALGLLLGVNLLVLLWLMTQPEPASEMPAAKQSAVAPPVTAPAPVQATPATAPADTVTVTRFNPPLIVDPVLREEGNALTPTPGPSTPAVAAFNPNDYLPATAVPNAPSAPSRDTGMANDATSNFATREALLARGLNVPEVSLSLHVYDADPVRSFVFVNGQRGREGETLPNGLRIERILPEGAVLSWNGNRFFAPLQ